MQQKAHWWVLIPDWVCISWTLYHWAATGFQPTIHFAVTLFCNVLLFISLFLDVSHTHNNTKNTLGEWNWISKRVHIAKQIFKQTASCNICNNKGLKKTYKKTYKKTHLKNMHAYKKNTHTHTHTHTHTQQQHPHPPKNKQQQQKQPKNPTNQTRKNY